MCLQCNVDAKEVMRFILPANPNAHPDSIDRLGWHLYIATKEDGDNTEWPNGWYGLLRINDPDFVFPLNIEDPNDQDWRTIYDAFYCDPVIGHDFYEACIREGYDRNFKPYMTIEKWFINRIISLLRLFKTLPSIPKD